MSYTLAAFVADAFGMAYATLLLAWVCKVYAGSDLLGPLQALSRAGGAEWIAAVGFAVAAGVAVKIGVVQGAAVAVGVGVACLVIEVGRRRLGPDYRPYNPGHGWSAMLHWLLWVGMAGVGIVFGIAAAAGASEAAGGILSG